MAIPNLKPNQSTNRIHQIRLSAITLLTILLTLSGTGCKPAEEPPPFPPSHLLYPDNSYLGWDAAAGHTNYKEFLDIMANYPLTSLSEQNNLSAALEHMAGLDLKWDEKAELWKGQIKYEEADSKFKVVVECWMEGTTAVWMLNLYSLNPFYNAERMNLLSSFRVATDFQSPELPFSLELACTGNFGLGNQAGTSPIVTVTSDGDDITYMIYTLGLLNSYRYIYKEMNGRIPYDRQMTLAHQTQDTAWVHWSSASREGGFYAPTALGDSSFQCWDNNLEDIACP